MKGVHEEGRRLSRQKEDEPILGVATPETQVQQQKERDRRELAEAVTGATADVA